MNILIAGGTGLVGSVLSGTLVAHGHHVALLSRHTNLHTAYPQFSWDIEKGHIDPKAFEQVDVLINLSGTGIADKRWTAAYKKQILESRTKGIQLLLHHAANSKSRIHTFISASAVGYYGLDTGDQKVNENAPNGIDYLAKVVQAWENEALKASSLGIRTVCLRTGVVLASTGGALPKLALPFRYSLGAALGSGQQYVSWIDVEDLTELYTFAAENSQLKGIYNAVSPTPVTNNELSHAIAKELNTPLWLPHLPSWALKAIVGEMANTLLGGNNVSSDKIMREGFVFLSPTLAESLKKRLHP